MLWHEPCPGPGELAHPDAALALLRRATAVNPANATLHVKLANVWLDRFDFEAAAAALEKAWRLEPAMPHLRSRLAACYNHVKRPEAALRVLADHPCPRHERGMALAALGRTGDAERELRAVLALEPSNRQACRMLGRILRQAYRWRELLDLCEELAAQGVGHSQLLYDWGAALALNGEEEKARAILLDPRRLVAIPLPPPAGCSDICAFNAALGEEILTNPHRVTPVAEEEHANRGSSRVHRLFSGRRPDLVRAFLSALEGAVDGAALPALGNFDPWAAARPEAARLQAWGLIQRGGDYEEWHLHRDGWLSGVYYVRVPKAVSSADRGRGCIEFGATGTLARLMPDLIRPVRIEPEEGMLLLAPSHYRHRTIPTESEDYRISFAFDVVPAGASQS